MENGTDDLEDIDPAMKAALDAIEADAKDELTRILDFLADRRIRLVIWFYALTCVLIAAIVWNPQDTIPGLWFSGVFFLCFASFLLVGNEKLSIARNDYVRILQVLNLCGLYASIIAGEIYHLVLAFGIPTHPLTSLRVTLLFVYMVLALSFFPAKVWDRLADRLDIGGS